MLAYSFHVNAQSPFEEQNAKFKKVFQDDGHLGMLAAYSINGKIVWSQSAGYRDAETQKPFDENTLTRVASLAKPMTAVACMQLVEKGQLDLDLKIQTYIPFYPEHPEGIITTRMLLAHTSGMGAYEKKEEKLNEVEYATMKDAAKVFQDRPLKFKPGTEFAYTTYGYVVLGLIIEEISQMSFEDYMLKNIWEPSGMTNTSVENRSIKNENRSQCYHKKGKNKKAKLFEPYSLSNRIPAGGLETTLGDLLNFGQAVIDHTLISEVSFQEMTTVDVLPKDGNPYGCGWFLYGQKGNENALIGHGGGQIGANTQLIIVPSQKLVVVALSNTSGTSNAISKLTIELMQLSQ